MVGDGMLAIPDAREMTSQANARRVAEKKDMDKRKKVRDRSYTLAVVKRMRPHWPLLFLGAAGAALAGAVCHPSIQKLCLTGK